MHGADIDLSGFLEVHAKATAQARNTSRPSLAIWREELGHVDPAALLGPLFERSGRSFFWESPQCGVIALGSSADFGADSAAGPGEADRFAGIRRSWESAMENAVTGGPGSGAAPALVGGFAFAPRPGTMPGALMWLPRVLIARDRDGRTTLSLSVRVDPGPATSDAAVRVAAEAVALLSRAGGHPCNPPRQAGTTLTEIPSGQEWKALVARAVEEIGRGAFDKIVVARQLRVSSPTAYDVPSVLAALLDAQPGSTVFGVGLDGHAFVGATPERLVSLHAGRAESMSLAASMPRGGTAAEDARLRATLLADDRSRREQGIVTQAVRHAFEQMCRHVELDEPYVLDLPNLRHLHTRIVGEIADPDVVSVLDLVERLHPTPAVGGHPREPALAWLDRAEPIDRGWYAGPVGWMNAAQDGDFAVALRSAHLRGGIATLYAGCGIVAGSDPGGELQETWLKFRPMLAALAVPESHEPPLQEEPENDHH
ncbi:isochorismate synthase [Nonomuraea sp. NBC_00507]|uniref:isochorismate synthase n=1 Tax=Nonomuraea sp. NBC_00507 TaxID=2976002 RepID=UPI002E18EAAE